MGGEVWVKSFYHFFTVIIQGHTAEEQSKTKIVRAHARITNSTCSQCSSLVCGICQCIETKQGKADHYTCFNKRTLSFRKFFTQDDLYWKPVNNIISLPYFFTFYRCRNCVWKCLLDTKGFILPSKHWGFSAVLTRTDQWGAWRGSRSLPGHTNREYMVKSHSLFTFLSILWSTD